VLELYNEAGQLVLAYKIYCCWVSEYQILPDLDANASAIAIEQVKLENEGWERDHSVPEPVEPASKNSYATLRPKSPHRDDFVAWIILWWHCGCSLRRAVSSLALATRTPDQASYRKSFSRYRA